MEHINELNQLKLFKSNFFFYYQSKKNQKDKNNKQLKSSVKYNQQT